MKRLIVCDTVYNYVIASMLEFDKEIIFIASAYTTRTQPQMIEKIKSKGTTVYFSLDQRDYVRNIYLLSKVLRSKRRDYEVLYFPSGSCAHYLVELMVPAALAVEEGIGAYVEDADAHNINQQILKYIIAAIFSCCIGSVALFHPSARTPISYAFFPDKLLTPSKIRLERLTVSPARLPDFGFSQEKIDVLLLDTVTPEKGKLMSEKKILSKVCSGFQEKNILLKRHPLHKREGWYSRIKNDYSDHAVDDVLLEELLHENIIVIGFQSTALYFTKVVYPSARVVMLTTNKEESDNSIAKILSEIVDSTVLI